MEYPLLRASPVNGSLGSVRVYSWARIITPTVDAGGWIRGALNVSARASAERERARTLLMRMRRHAPNRGSQSPVMATEGRCRRLRACCIKDTVKYARLNEPSAPLKGRALCHL